MHTWAVVYVRNYKTVPVVYIEHLVCGYVVLRCYLWKINQQKYAIFILVYFDLSYNPHYLFIYFFYAKDNTHNQNTTLKGLIKPIIIQNRRRNSNNIYISRMTSLYRPLSDLVSKTVLLSRNPRQLPAGMKG